MTLSLHFFVHILLCKQTADHIPAVVVEVAGIRAVELVAVCFEDFRSPYQKGGDCLGLERYQTLTKNPNHYNNRRVTEKKNDYVKLRHKS